MITMEKLRQGFLDGAAMLLEGPHDGGTVCKIGEHWFYFDPTEDAELPPGKYQAKVPMDTVLERVLKGLEDLKTDVSEDEYDYYDAVLDEAASMKFMVREYGPKGDALRNRHFACIADAVGAFVRIRDRVPDWKNSQACWPTIWVRKDGQGFRRIHEFAFAEPSPENIKKYLSERVIDGDELLDGIKI